MKKSASQPNEITFDGIADSYRHVCEKAFAWHDRIQSSARKCKSGCDACCHGLFDITILDINLLRQAFESLPAFLQAYVTEQAQAIKADMLRSFDAASFAHIQEEDEDRFFDTFADRACPFLYQGACLVYESRTYICRMTGVPFYDGSEWDDSPICDINYPKNEYLKENNAVQLYRYDEDAFFKAEEKLLDELEKCADENFKPVIRAFYVIPDVIDFLANAHEGDADD